MPTAQVRYRTADAKAFRDVLAAWLASLPPDGWDGTIRELETALGEAKAASGIRGRVPRGNALGVRVRDELGFLEAHGFAVAFRRTAAARTIRIRKWDSTPLRLE